MPKRWGAGGVSFLWVHSLVSCPQNAHMGRTNLTYWVTFRKRRGGGVEEEEEERKKNKSNKKTATRRRNKISWEDLEAGRREPEGGIGQDIPYASVKFSTNK